MSLSGSYVCQLVLNGIIAGAIYALTALGFSQVYRTVRFFHFAHGAVYSAGAYAAFFIVDRTGAGLVFGVVGGSLCAAMLGVAIDRLAYKPLRKRHASSLILLICSFGVFLVIQSALQLIFGTETRSLVEKVQQGYSIGPVVITGKQLAIIGSALALSALVLIGDMRTGLGRFMRAVADDPVGASVVGIDPEKVIAWAFGIGSALAGVAGILASLETNIQPSMGSSAVIKAIIASILGGIRSPIGAVTGGFLLGLAENLPLIWFPVAWKDVIAFTLLMLVLLLRPQGIFGHRTAIERR